MPSFVFEPAVPASEQRQTQTFHRAATVTGYLLLEPLTFNYTRYAEVQSQI
jgi:hypothetical protein